MSSPSDPRLTQYSSPLAERYASPEMLRLWSPATRYGLWRQLWLALAEAEQALGIQIPDAAIAQMRAHLDDIDFDAVATYERRFRHDVMAHVHAFGDVAPAAKPVIHLGATSAYVTDNADLILMRRGLDILRGRVITALRALSAFARQWRDEPTLGYTHLQPAQLTTVGKRATLWMQDLVLDLMDLDFRRATLPFRGVKGTTGTQASFLELFQGDHDKVRELDRRVTAAMDFTHSLAVTGQTYTRKIDAQVLGVVTGVAASAAKFSGDIRMLQAFGEIEEPFETEQIGSSAMAYKRNPMRAERIASLARFVGSLEPNANQTHAVQYFERTLDDSANRRLVIPESFLATDAILILLGNIARGLEVHPARIRQRVNDELPFMATEELILRAVRAGGDRQAAHEVIRRHSVAAARAIKDGGAARNDMLERLAADPEYGVPIDDLHAALEPHRFIGRAAAQVDEFLDDVVEPLLAGATTVEVHDTVEVRV
ncbi:MAG TPA: adenylosuccinate lyase [Gemmatimonadaceae bacterium]|nr:adenylosuccinate lyase [Gemmatimonadaceae bacterium]